jgi:hypothetical protein
MTYGNCGPGWGGRRYFSREERIEWLKEYQEQLEGELQGVKERLAELKEQSA